MKKILSIILFSIVTPVLALNPAGKYFYTENGYSGKMTLFKDSKSTDAWIVKIESVSTTGYTCDVDAIGKFFFISENEIKANFESKNDMAEYGISAAKFTIRFTKNKAFLNVYSRGGDCGLNGDFKGNWVKQKNSFNSFQPPSPKAWLPTPTPYPIVPDTKPSK